MKINKIFKLCGFALFCLLSLNGCNDFLDEPTSKTNDVEFKTTDEADALFGNLIIFYSEANGTSIYGTDDYELIKDMYDASSKAYAIAAVQFSTWDVEGTKVNTLANDWTKEYKKIFYANMLLNNINKISGTQAKKDELAAEAHLIRAYAYISLANTYCLPYSESTKSEMGLPLKQTVKFEELSSRNTLDETHKLIEDDLEAAASIKRKLINGEKTRSWRASSGAVNAISARYWLTRNDYEKALDFADKALSEYNELVDYNTDMYYSSRVANVTVTKADGSKETASVQYPYTAYEGSVFALSSSTVEWKEMYYFRMLEHGASWYIPSQELLDLYRENDGDLRYKYHIVEHYSYIRGIKNPAYDYPGYVFFSYHRIPSGPTVGEMYLIKAECLARLNMVPEAMKTLNTLRAARFDKNTYKEEVAANKEEAVRKIINERRRELPFTARWSDCRRYNNNEDGTDDVEYRRLFYPYITSGVLASEAPIEYVLKKNSRRWASPIPQTDIDSSNGELLQNKY